MDVIKEKIMRELTPILLSMLLLSGCMAVPTPADSYRQIRVDEAIAREALRLGANKLPVKAKFIKKGE